ncbi:putative non-specific lipid-transfer protein 14 [Silene latifolia]|uniref:putative non-specific lipid-transfer protein 14 n=1 Tax=Silene latifolia TaxID=37657 RepID=UPI003D773F72
MSYVEICILLIVLVSPKWQVKAEIDCPTVTQLLSTCSAFITFGTPDPLPGSPCCDAMVGLSHLGDSTENRQSICKCIMGLIDTYDPNSTAIATLPGYCGVSLGFIVEPNIDCSMIS